MYFETWYDHRFTIKRQPKPVSEIAQGISNPIARGGKAGGGRAISTELPHSQSRSSDIPDSVPVSCRSIQIQDDNRWLSKRPWEGRTYMTGRSPQGIPRHSAEGTTAPDFARTRHILMREFLTETKAVLLLQGNKVTEKCTSTLYMPQLF
jgi:hypothetical protein